MIDIAEFLTKLSTKRPVFHSEADFQHAFAWELHQQFPNASIRLEYPVLQSNKQIYLDVRALHNDTFLAVELKYKTRLLSIQIDDERFSLKNQSAQDIGRYDFIKDIRRLEQATFGRKNVVGYAVLLTNDSSYWKLPTETNTVDAHFRIQEGRVLQGVLSWGTGASAGTTRGREETIELSGTYTLQWKDYSQPSTGSYGKFRYLAIKVVG